MFSPVAISVALSIGSPSTHFFLSVAFLFQFVISYCLIYKIMKNMPFWGLGQLISGF